MLTLFSKTELKCLNDVHLRYAFTLDNGNCPPAYFDIMNKCLWLTCGGSNHTYAEYRCSQNFGTLASLDETGMTRLAEYLDHIRARSVGITQVSYVLKSESYNALPAHTLREFIRLPNGAGRTLGGGGWPLPQLFKIGPEKCILDNQFGPRSGRRTSDILDRYIYIIKIN